MKHALRQTSQETAPAQPRRAPSTTSNTATVIQLSAAPGGSRANAPGKAAPAPAVPPVRRGSRGGDLIFGGALALILLIACLTWEMLSHGDEPPHAAYPGEGRAFVPAVQ